MGKALGVRFEAFGPGPDGGIDGRHADGDKKTVLQAKHYAGSTFAQLCTAMRKERAAIDRLKPNRYVLVTSRPLSPLNKARLATIIGPTLKHESDIVAQGDLNLLLREHPAVERAHLKLWLSSSTVLETIMKAVVHTGSRMFSNNSRDELANKVKVYAQNESLPQAQQVLDKQHVLIISGPPGVGKTTLGEMLSFAYISEGWDLIALRGLEDGFERIDDTRKQIFFFDDFLGTIALDQRALAAKDSELALFMNRVRRSPNARFILTTRAYILNEARQASERLADRRVKLSTYVLDLSAYTRAIRSRILYNHLALGGIPSSHVIALIESGLLPQIVDHRNYNPRIIEWMTDVLRIADIASNKYPSMFIDILDNPDQLWDRAFRNHITPSARHLLIALFFSGPFETKITDLRTLFETFHARMCGDLRIPRDPKDFEQSLKHVEGSFVAIENGAVDFINPSVRDYLAGYLTDEVLLSTIMSSALSGYAARELWTFAKRKLDWLQLTAIARSALLVIPRMFDKSESLDGNLDSSDRISLLLEWWAQTGMDEFAKTALSIASDPPKRFTAWRDGPRVLKTISELNDGGHFEQGIQTKALIGALETVAVELFEGYISSDDLLKMSDIIEDGPDYSRDVRNALHNAIVREFDDPTEGAYNFSSQSDLEEHADALKQLARRAPIPESVLARALEHVDERISEVESRSTESSDPDLIKSKSPDDESFDDNALGNLFDSLRCVTSGSLPKI